MKTTVTIEFDGDDAVAVHELTHGVDLGTLLRDALGEFIRAREPVETYIARRYAANTDQVRRQKVREVTKRIKLAEVLHRGDITIEVQS
jgi:hypothetical protein